MYEDLIWRKESVINPRMYEMGLTDKAFEMLGQIWAIVPINERKKNYNENEALFTVEGSDSLTTISAPFNIKRMNYTNNAIDRPDELDSSTPLIIAEV
jgi:glycine cleavage system H lipoate-binding protein